MFALRQGGPAFEEGIAAPVPSSPRDCLKILGRQNLVHAVPPQGAMYVMLDIRATGLSGIDFAERLLSERRIAVMPGESFGASAAGHVRVALTIEDKAFAKAFEEVLKFAAGQI